MRRPPIDYVRDGSWPHATLSADAPPGAHYAQALAATLFAVMSEQRFTVRALSTRSGLSRRTIERILGGLNHADINTVAQLETILRHDLYPIGLYRHIPPAGNGRDP